MKRLSILVAFAGFLFFFSACGPMTAPMVPRLEKEEQKIVDDGWEKALTPANRLDHQVLLDTLVGIGAYQRGVDKLYLRSEKRFSGGVVVMEIHFDLASPSEDRFEVKVIGQDGKVLRSERYSRDEVDTTFHDLFEFRGFPKDEKEPPELAQKRAKQEARWAKIREFFPKRKDDVK